MKRSLLLVLLLGLLAGPVWAQQFKSITLPLQTAQTGDANGNEITIDGMSSLSVQVTVSGTATVNFEATQDQSTWTSVACIEAGDITYTSITDTSETMTVRCNVAGLVKFRTRTSGNSGSVTTTATASPAVMGSGGGGGSGGVSGWPSSSATKEVTWANSLANALLISGGGVRKLAFYDDATDGLQIKCVVSGVPDACNIIRLLGSGFRLEYTNSSAVAIFTLTESTGALTNVTLNGESTGNTITLTEENWFDVVACQDTTAQHIWNTIAATFPAATCDTGSNTQKGYASFDATTDEAIQMDWVLPTGWTGAIDIHFIWKAAATSGAVGWCAQLIRVADASTSDPAFPAQASGNCVSDTAKGTTLQENHATISGVTCTSCAARDHVYVRVSRNGDGGGSVTDDMTGDAHLMKVGRTWRVAH